MGNDETEAQSCEEWLNEIASDTMRRTANKEILRCILRHQNGYNANGHLAISLPVRLPLILRAVRRCTTSIPEERMYDFTTNCLAELYELGWVEEIPNGAEDDPSYIISTGTPKTDMFNILDNLFEVI